MTAIELAAAVHALGLPVVYVFVSSEIARVIVAAVSGVDTDSGSRVYRVLLLHVLFFALVFDPGDDLGGRGLGGRLRRRARSLLTSAAPIASPS